MPMNFERSLLTETVVLILRGVNDEISYQQLAKLAGTSVDRVKTAVPSAKRILANEKIEFGVIHGQGLKRMGEVDKAHKTEANKKRIGRAAGRAEKHAARIKLDALPPAEQLMVTTNRTVFGFMRRQARVKPEEPQTKAAAAPSTDTGALIKLVKSK
jgi:hypothetical protein